MNGPRLTEERLRNHLDTNQPMRERMCLALLPLLGPYTREQPRRPKGGPDGGRDIEALYQGQIVIWGAVGFRNGGGSDEAARNDAEAKFKADLDRALDENPSLQRFLFFTNVDLTPSRKSSLTKYARAKNVVVTEIFDMERLRHALDSPEGLIPRLQYLEIPMSNTEQAALVAKFGNQLQNAVTQRFDRVERTLASMERFLQFQKPLLRLDLYMELNSPSTSMKIGDEAVLFNLGGLHNINKTFSCLCVNNTIHARSGMTVIVSAHMWNEEKPGKVLSLPPSIAMAPNVMTSYNELSLSTGGQRVRIADLTIVTCEVLCTESIRERIRRISIDINGYNLFGCKADGEGEASGMKFPPGLPYKATDKKWVYLLKTKTRNLLFDPPEPSRRYHPIQSVGGP